MASTAQPTTANRRKSQRRKVRTSVKVECRKGAYGLGANICQRVLDLSDTGVRMITAHELPAEGEVEVVISSYGMREHLKRISYVRWQVKLDDGNYCIGIEFQKRLAYRDWQTLASPG